MAYKRNYLMYRLNRLNSWITGGYVSNTRERWTSEDMFWAYRLGLRRGRR